MTDVVNLQSATTVVEQLSAFLNDLYRTYQPLKGGAVANYIPELAKANPDWFGISVVTADGQVCDVGDTSVLFTMQSISKPFVYGLALEDRGREYVLSRIGVEPTGDSFNEIIEPEAISQRRYNPMVNAGAIATTSLIEGANSRERRNRLFQMFRRYIGHDVEVDWAVFRSRQTTDNLNRAIAYLMLNFDLIDGNVEEILDLYFQQCSLMVNCHDLAVMAATLANAGINPTTGERALDACYVKHLTSIMYTCGMYDFSGQWAYRVGLPAKGGLSGAIIAVVPNQMGIAVFSPPLEHHKSLRGVKVFEALSEKFQLHIFSGVTAPQVLGCQHGNATPCTDNNTTDPSELPQARSIRRRENPKSKSLAGVHGAPPKEKRKRSSTQNPVEASLATFLKELHHQYLPWCEGKIYLSEPNLVEINPNWFGICVVTVDGQVYKVGDWDVPFLIQSISKIFAYGLALEDHGRDYILTKVDVEPTGEAYDSIIKVEVKSKRPYNPMVNTGAIAITSLIEGAGPALRLNRVLEMYRRYIGHRVFVDTPTFVSEQTGGDRNQAISHLLRHFKMISGDISQILDLYLQQCSVIINCCDLAVMGATLANNGVNPITRERAINSAYVKDLLSVMYTCGMYDFAGEWVYNIGFPAKSGVGGGIIAVVPGQMGIAVFSPLLDKRGSSVRGIKVCEELSRHLRLHVFEPLTPNENRD